MKILSLDDVRAGDIMVSGMSTAPTKIVVYGGQFLLGEQFRVGRFVAGHAGVVVPGGRLVEAMPRGARIRDLRETDWSPAHAYFRLPEDYEGQAKDAASVAMAMIGTPYSIASYAYLAAYLGGIQSECLADRINRRRDPIVLPLFHKPGPNWNLGIRLPVEAICSVLAEQSWTLTGKEVVLNTKPQVVTPGMLTGQLYGREGVIRGGLGLP